MVELRAYEWFFARNILEPFGGEYTPDDRELDYLLNSYYVSLGARLARNRRGFVTRPTTAEIYRYRASVDARVERLLERIDQSRWAELEAVLRIGINHEQQHQELFYTEIKYILFQNPAELREAYRPAADAGCTQVPPSGGRSRDLEGETQNISGGLLEFGHRDGGWCWDNELPVHKQYLNDFAIARRLVTCGEYLEFVEEGGYRQPLLWLDNGWRAVAEQGWSAPLYWEQHDGEWWLWTLTGMRRLEPAEPVCHVSFYEADAFARWKAERSGRLADGTAAN